MAIIDEKHVFDTGKGSGGGTSNRKPPAMKRNTPQNWKRNMQKEYTRHRKTSNFHSQTPGYWGITSGKNIQLPGMYVLMTKQ